MGSDKFSVGPLETGQISCNGQPILQEFPSTGTCGKVGPLETGQISCNGQPILQEFPSTGTCGKVELSYDDQGKLVDNAQGTLEKKIVHANFPGGHLQIMRWANHLNVRVTMAPTTAGQDGVCGNFNGDPDDDSTDLILQRLGGRIPEGELLFRSATKVMPGAPPAPSIEDCDRAKHGHAEALCKATQPNAAGLMLDSCIFDVCFGGDQYAGEDGLSLGQVQP
mmetsp:Transcript_58807/g.190401  ORF Transcript_58807/g.190401 Transcript_58807/m.190401 type:complete len:223 (-) Transcript_58807:474-1142(-)